MSVRCNGFYRDKKAPFCYLAQCENTNKWAIVCRVFVSGQPMWTWMSQCLKSWLFHPHLVHLALIWKTKKSRGNALNSCTCAPGLQWLSLGEFQPFLSASLLYISGMRWEFFTCRNIKQWNQQSKHEVISIPSGPVDHIQHFSLNYLFIFVFPPHSSLSWVCRVCASANVRIEKVSLFKFRFDFICWQSNLVHTNCSLTWICKRFSLPLLGEPKIYFLQTLDYFLLVTAL